MFLLINFKNTLICRTQWEQYKNEEFARLYERNYKNTINGLDEIKNMQANAGFSMSNLTALKDKLGVSLPMQSMEKFNEVEEKLKNDTDLQNEI